MKENCATAAPVVRAANALTDDGGSVKKCLKALGDLRLGQINGSCEWSLKLVR